MSDLLDLEVTDDELGLLVGVSGRHIRRLIGDARTGRNRYRLQVAIPALIDAMSGGGAGADLTKERVRKLRADATMAELALAKARGEVAPLEEIEKAWGLLLTTIRTNVMNVPARVVLQLLGETDEANFKKVLRGELTEALVRASEAELELEEV
ncbi:MAG: hypothetical protein EON58_15865 [Alphaproteobacteria bacterium]|nr:MAG: hypothetical protein EON58_15865 [Alphaproteobacteria bacterium]